MGRVLFGRGASLVAQRVKNLPKMQKTWVQSLHREDPLEKEMATHPSILAWGIHGQRTLEGYSPWLQSRVAKRQTGLAFSPPPPPWSPRRGDAGEWRVGGGHSLNDKGAT